MFDFNQSVARGRRADYDARPTVVGLVVAPGKGGDKIFLVQPKEADPGAWIPPQGEIRITESPFEALMRELFEECRWESDLFDSQSAVPLVKVTASARQVNNPDKDYHVIGLRLKRWVKPRLNGENRKFLLAGGPNCLWTCIAGCRPSKQKLIVSCLERAAKGFGGRPPILLGSRWRTKRLVPLMKYVGT